MFLRVVDRDVILHRHSDWGSMDVLSALLALRACGMEPQGQEIPGQACLLSRWHYRVDSLLHFRHHSLWNVMRLGYRISWLFLFFQIHAYWTVGLWGVDGLYRGARDDAEDDKHWR